MTTEQARRAVAALPNDEELGRKAAKEYWKDGVWAKLYVTGYDFAALFGPVWERAYLETIDAFRLTDPEKAEREEAAAREKVRRDRMAEEAKRRSKAEARAKARAKRENPQAKNPLLPVPKVLCIVRNPNWRRIPRRHFR